MRTTRVAPDIALLKSTVLPGDVLQGGLGDCWLLGALSVLAHGEHALLDVFPVLDESLHDGKGRADLPVSAAAGASARHQEYNEEGVYAVRFVRDGEPLVVVVDDFLPCDDDGWPVMAIPPQDRVSASPRALLARPTRRRRSRAAPLVCSLAGGHLASHRREGVREAERFL